MFPRVQRYRLHDGFRAFEVWDAMAEPMTQQERREVEDLLSLRLLDNLVYDPQHVEILAAMLRQVGHGWVNPKRVPDEFLDDVGRGAIGVRMLPLLEDLPRAAPRREVPKDDPQPREPIVPLVGSRWIEIHVHDRDGAPLVDLDYQLEVPDGETIEGRLGKDATVRVDGIIASGSCRITFPRLVDHPRPLGVGTQPSAAVETTITYRHEQSIALLTDRVHRIIVEPPPPQPAVSFRGSMFGRESAFPTSAIAPLLRWAQEWTDEPDNRGRSLGVFAHADGSGDEQPNKELSDRRALVVYAMLTGELGPLQDVAERDAWGTAECQAMLRALGCNPGAIDGAEGPMTAAAVRLFRREYNADVFHREVRPRAHGDLADGETLDASTRDALIDAYHAEYSVAVPVDRFWGPRHMGCGEFNRFAAKASIVRDRRVTLVQYGASRPREVDFPCCTDDASSCAIDEDDGSRRCRFYRDNIADDAIDEPFPFWDFDWLSTPKGNAHLSALTTLPDTDDLEFVVELLHGSLVPEDSDYGIAPASRGLELDRVTGLVRKGVAYALWQRPEHYDPFDASRWFEYVPEETERRLILPPFQPPVFAIDADAEDGPVWGLAGPPGKELRHLHFTGEGSGPATAIRNDGRFLWVEDIGRLDEVAEGNRIVAVFRPETRFEPEGA